MLREHCLPVLTGDDVALDKLVQTNFVPRFEDASQASCLDGDEHPLAGSRLETPHTTTAPRFGTRLDDLRWIDPFVAQIRPYVRVRLEDGVLIKMPMEVFQLSRTGLQLLHRALQGETIAEVAAAIGAAAHGQRIYQIHTFFCDLRDLLQQRLGDGRGRPTTRVAPFAGSFTRYPVLSEIAVTYRCNLACSFCYAGCGTADASPGNARRERHRHEWKFWRNWPWWQRRFPPRDPLRQEMTAEGSADRHRSAGRGRESAERQLYGRRMYAAAGIAAVHRPCTPDGHACQHHYQWRGLQFARLRRQTGGGRSHVGSSQPVRPLPRYPRPFGTKGGRFRKTVQGICHLRDAGLHVHTNTTICEENAQYLCEIIDLAQSLDLPHVSMNQIIPTGTPNLPRHEKLKVSYSRIGHYVLQAQEHAERVGIEFHWYSPTPFCIFNPIAHGLGNKGCAACDGLVHVSPSGDVLPCSSFARGVGNLLEQGFEKVWFGKDAQYYKQKRAAHPICRRCEHFALCQGACTLYWSGMGYEELREARRGR